MHDIKTLDSRGVPGVAIVTTGFRDAAAIQGRALGYTPHVVWVPHPIQNMPPKDLADLAHTIADEVVAACSPPDA